MEVKEMNTKGAIEFCEYLKKEDIENFRENGRQVPECQIGCILSEGLIKKLNEYCDETTKFSMAVYDESLPRRYDLNLGWWFKKKEAKSDES